MNKDTISDFKYLLKNIASFDALSVKNASEAYVSFFSKFADLCKIAFLEKEVKIKTKNLMSPRITKGPVKSSKRKQKLYEKFFLKKVMKTRKSTKHIKAYLKKLRKTVRTLFLR